MTQSEAIRRIRSIGMSVTVKDGEFRITDPTDARKDRERLAYYTDDPEDAVGTAVLLKRR